MLPDRTAEIEQVIVATVKQTLTDDPTANSEQLHAALVGRGIILQPFDLSFVLSRHPAIFRLSYKGQWSLA
jgi:hypothetical protein